MSGLISGVKKVFKKVAKVVKKIALPALAIGAVVLTGGAALGVLPSIGSLGASLGLSGGLTSVLSSAASAATMGAVTSAVTGGNIIKGATAGLITGGAIGAAGQLAGGMGRSVAQTAGNMSGGSPGSAAVPAQTGNGGWSVPMDGSPMGGSAPAISNGMGTAYVGGNTGGTGGILGFLDRNPIVGGQLIQGIGSGLLAGNQAKEARKAAEAEAANYSDTSQLYRQPSVDGSEEVPVDGPSIAYTGGRYVFDKNTGRVRVATGG